MNDQPIFDHEKLDVYQVELSFITSSERFDSSPAREDEESRAEDENDHEHE